MSTTQTYELLHLGNSKQVQELKFLEKQLETTAKAQQNLGKESQQILPKWQKAQKAAGDYATTQKQLKTQITNLKAEIEQQSATYVKYTETTSQASTSFSEKLLNTYETVANYVSTTVGVFQTISAVAVDLATAYDSQLNAETKLQNAIGGNTEALQQQAKALQEKTRYSDQEILSSQASLAQMGLHKAHIQELTPAVLNLAAAQGIDLATATKEVGNAILKGGSDLEKYGIALGNSTKGNERLNTAIGQLSSQFGGQAELMGKMGSGPLVVVGNAFNEIKETLGEIVAKHLVKLLPGLQKLLKNLGYFFQSKDFALGLKHIKTALADYFGMFAPIWNGLLKLGKSLGVVSDKGNQFSGVVKMLTDYFKWLMLPVKALLKVWGFAINIVAAVADGIKSLADRINTLINKSKLLNTGIQVLSKAFEGFVFPIQTAIKGIENFGNWLGKLINKNEQAAKSVAKLGNALQDLEREERTNPKDRLILDAIEQTGDSFETAQAAIQELIDQGQPFSQALQQYINSALALPDVSTFDFDAGADSDGAYETPLEDNSEKRVERVNTKYEDRKLENSEQLLADLQAAGNNPEERLKAQEKFNEAMLELEVNLQTELLAVVKPEEKLATEQALADAEIELNQYKADKEIAIVEETAEKEAEIEERRNTRKQTIREAEEQAEIELQERRRERFDQAINYLTEVTSIATDLIDMRMQKELEAAEGNEQKQDQIRKKYGEKRKKAEVVQATIALTAELGNIAAQAAANPSNAISFGAAGAVQAAILSAIAITNYGIRVAKIKSQKFAQGGLATLGGVLQGPSHQLGGVPARLARGGFIELEGGEAIINKRSTSMFREHLSAMNVAGGGKRFAYGGLTAPMPLASPSANINTSLNQSLDAINNRIDRIKVVNVATDTQGTFTTVNNIQAEASF